MIGNITLLRLIATHSLTSPFIVTSSSRNVVSLMIHGCRASNFFHHFLVYKESGGLSVVGSRFEKFTDTAVKVTGAIGWRPEYYESQVRSNTYVEFENSYFFQCQSTGNGGAILITSTTGPFHVSNCGFFECKAARGGGIYAYERGSEDAVDELWTSCFFSCEATTTSTGGRNGQAIFTRNAHDRTNVSKCLFVNCERDANINILSNVIGTECKSITVENCNCTGQKSNTGAVGFVLGAWNRDLDTVLQYNYVEGIRARFIFWVEFSNAVRTCYMNNNFITNFTMVTVSGWAAAFLFKANDANADGSTAYISDCYVLKTDLDWKSGDEFRFVADISYGGYVVMVTCINCFTDKEALLIDQTGISVTSDFETSFECLDDEYCFNPTNVFSDSEKFSATDVFSGSHGFTKTGGFTKTDGFTKTGGFTKTDSFTKTDGFANSDSFSKSDAFSKSLSIGNDDAPDDSSAGDDTISGGAVAGIVVGVVILLAGAAFVLFFVWKKKEANSGDDHDDAVEATGENIPINDTASGTFLSTAQGFNMAFQDAFGNDHEEL